MSIEAALDLMRRLPPRNVQQNLDRLIQIAPDFAEELLSLIDQPLETKVSSNGQEFIICDYNRDGDSYRCPYTNEYVPQLDDGVKPSVELRKLEIAANDAFTIYREMYYEGGISSVYFWDLESGFAAVILIKKTADSGKLSSGNWNSVHVFEVEERKNSANYKLTSTVLLDLKQETDAVGIFDLSGSLTRQLEQELSLNEQNGHIANMGHLVEDMELKIRSSLQEVYFGKTKNIVNELRSVEDLEFLRQQNEVQRQVISKMMADKPCSAKTVDVVAEGVQGVVISE